MHGDLYICSKDIKVETAIKNDPMGYYHLKPSFPHLEKKLCFLPDVKQPKHHCQ